jgi:alanyl-tRNA synthetase
MTSDEIRERYLSFFEERGHLRIPSASLVPSAHDPSALLTVAGMHPLKPYFLGQEVPPRPRLTDCQKVFRTVDIDNVGNTARHLTFFEMLGNFSFGDYFKREAIGFAWELSREVFGFREQDIWVTVFEGDEELGLGPDEEAIECWVQEGVPRERIVLCPRSENFWQAGPTGPCGPCSELYLDRGSAFGPDSDRPGGDTERFLEYWNLVFMQYDQRPAGSGGATELKPLPANNIDTGLGLNRMAAILQEKPSVFETDQFMPLIELGEELSGASYGAAFESDRALRVLADHARACTFLIADGVVPSNEDRGYVLRRVMRRAIHQGRVLELAPGFMVRYGQRVGELMGGAYPELLEQADVIDMWLAAEEQSFGRTLDQGTQTLREEVERVRSAGAGALSAEVVFRLHDTFGLPYDMTRELLAEEGLSIEGDFDELMEAQRERGRAGTRASAATGDSAREAASAFAGEAGSVTTFTGYERTEQPTTVAALQSIPANGSPGFLVKLAESPFYAPGGGQVGDVGTIECENGDCRARVEDVFRLGDDQALSVVVERGTLSPGEAVVARVDARARRDTECNHTATHLLQAALRRVLGTHVRQAGSYVGPDKLRFDFSHGAALSEEELRDVEALVNEWIYRNDPVRPITTTLDEARRLGAMALFGEKYGDVVRMVQIGEGEYSRELCGGTHVRSTAEIGAFRIISETSSSANVRRIEALSGPPAVEQLRSHDVLLAELASELRSRPEDAPDALRAVLKARKELERAARKGPAGSAVDLDKLLAEAEDVDGAAVLVAGAEAPDQKSLLEVLDRVKGRLGDGVIVLAAPGEGRVHLVASVAPALVQRGLKAGELVKVAAAEVGGGGGGRDTIAQAGGRDPERLGEALRRARQAIAETLGSG